MQKSIKQHKFYRYVPMAKSGIYAFGVIYQTKVVYVYQDKIGHVEKGKISIWIRLSIFRVAVSMRILGLDMGSKTIGVALSDPLGWTAQGITTIRRTKKEQDLEEVHKICKEYNVETIVIGLPKNMNGTIGEAGEKALEFAELLKEKTELPIEMWDERLTTVAAHRAMLEADLSRNKRKKIVDKIAATYILQGYLDRLRLTSK